MKKIVINGGRPLKGEISVSGSKNAALPIIFATVVTGGVSRIHGLPDIGDVRVALDILRSFGAVVDREGELTVIDTRYLSYGEPDDSLVSGIRASTYLIGACLSRFGFARIRPFGGCNFAGRPIDIHLDVCRSLGATVTEGVITADRLRGGEVRLRLPSVGATVNALLMAVSAAGDSVIYGAACEPHVDALIEFLTSAGACILRRLDGIYVSPTRLTGGCVRVERDMIEAGSYLAASLATDGCVRLADAPTESLTATLELFSRIGAEVEYSGRTIAVKGRGELIYASAVAAPYPAFPTDLLPVVSPLMSISGGRMTDTVWPTRFGYLSQLAAFGLLSSARDGSAEIFPSRLHSARVTAPDLRGGMACVIAALMAEGESTVYDADKILRGYERLEEKLTALGAEVKISEY